MFRAPTARHETARGADAVRHQTPGLQQKENQALQGRHNRIVRSVMPPFQGLEEHLVRIAFPGLRATHSTPGYLMPPRCGLGIQIPFFPAL